MRSFTDHIVRESCPLREVLTRLDELGRDAVVFVLDDEEMLQGSITDGDIRRGLLSGKTLQDPLDSFMNKNPKWVYKHDFILKRMNELKRAGYTIIPIVDQKKRITRIVNFNVLLSCLPVDALIMAGGRGSRLRPLTDSTPKPLLKVGNKPIIDHNVDRLIRFGIDNFFISVRYLGEQLETHFARRAGRSTSFEFIWEKEPLGTLGAASLIESFQNEVVLITNSDILTLLNYEDFYLDFIESDADMSVASIPFDVKVPYAVMDVENNNILSFQEKPTYTYFSNGGIYLVKKDAP